MNCVSLKEVECHFGVLHGYIMKDYRYICFPLTQAASTKPDLLVAKETSQSIAAAPKPQPRSQPKPSNLIDLSAPEFDEFNLSEADLAAFSKNLVDDRAPKQEAVQVEKLQQRSSSTAPKPQLHV